MRNKYLKVKVFAIFLFFSLFLTFQVFPQSTPQQTFKNYKQALKEGDIREYFNLITSDSKKIVNPSRPLMKREYNDLKDLDFYVEKKSCCEAVIYFRPPSKKVPPYLLKKEGGTWKIDLKKMSQVYVFDTNNNWHYKERGGAK